MPAGGQYNVIDSMVPEGPPEYQSIRQHWDHIREFWKPYEQDDFEESYKGPVDSHGYAELEPPPGPDVDFVARRYMLQFKYYEFLSNRVRRLLYWDAVRAA